MSDKPNIRIDSYSFELEPPTRMYSANGFKYERLNTYGKLTVTISCSYEDAAKVLDELKKIEAAPW